MNKLKFMFMSLIDVIIYIFYKLYFFITRVEKNDVWLISERGNDARDNGYCFYKYMKDKHPEIKVKYIITKNSSDYKKIDEDDVVEYRTKEHYYYFFFAKYLISAEIMGFSPNERLYYRLNKYGFLKVNGKTIFLQHGIMKDFISYYTKENCKVDLFICGAIPEHKYMLEKYGYSNKEVVCTGLARFDNLENMNKKIILVMPTWRKFLKYSDTIKDSEFFEAYMKLLNDDEIIAKLDEKKYKLIFYPHILMQNFLKEFSTKSTNVILASFEKFDVQDLLKKSSVLVTDYSSVAFDLAYMRKKTIYYQFDLEKYRKTQYSDGYFSYEKDGFGPVVFDYETLKQQILDFLENNKCLNNFDYRIEKFFKSYDKNNCERIYDEIIKL